MSLLTRPIVGSHAAWDKARGGVAVVCAGSSGVHAALVPEHLRESALLGGSFALAALVLGALAAAISTPGHAPWATAAAMTALIAIAALYVLSRTSGIPLLIPHSEGPDPLGVVTTTAELIAALAAAASLNRKDQT